jgi:hypothetical protein
VVQVGTSKISGCTISLQAAVHPGSISYRNPTLKKNTNIKFSDEELTLLNKGLKAQIKNIDNIVVLTVCN